MTRIRFPKLAIPALALFAASAVAQSTQPPKPLPVITDHAADSYTIYSLLLSTGSAGQQSRSGDSLAIAGTTISADNIQTEPDRELQPPPESERAFAEAVQDYQVRREKEVQLQHQLKLDRPYSLLTGDEVAEFRKRMGSGAKPSSLTVFSEVFFNPAQTAALVYMDHACSTPCGNGQWIYLEKQSGEWARRSSSTFDRADTYAIYSLLMPGVPFQSMSPSQAPHFAIAAETVNIDDMNPAIPPDGQLQPPPDNARGFREAVQDFNTRKYERMAIEDRLNLDRPYILVDANDAADLRSTLGGIDPGSQLQDKWAGYPGITYFSEVYFDSTHKAALVYMNNFCANLCANGQWVYLEKRGDQWVRRSGLNI